MDVVELLSAGFVKKFPAHNYLTEPNFVSNAKTRENLIKATHYIISVER
jgi:hypothetical protein